MESTERDARSSVRARHAAARVAPARGPGRLHREAAGERPPRARPQRRGSPGPIPNPAVKPAFAESTAARGCGRAGRRARGGRFSYAHARPGRRARRMRRERPAGGGIAPAGFSAFWGTPEGAFPRPGARPTAGGACATSADRGAGGPPGGASLPGGPSFGRCAPARFCAVCAPCRRLQVFYSCLCAIGWSEAGFLSLCAASRFGLLLVAESVYEDYNLKAMYSSLAQCRCRGLYEPLISACTFGTYKV